jgi:hypothetical protein
MNIALVALALLGGYCSLSPEKLRNTNPDAILCGLILLLMPCFAIGSVGYSIRRWNHSRLARPSLSRNPLNWWHDPLQSLFISTCIMVSMAIGSALRRPAIGSVGFWTLAVYACLALGLLIGQILVYRIYRQNIIAARCRSEASNELPYNVTGRRCKPRRTFDRGFTVPGSLFARDKHAN